MKLLRSWSLATASCVALLLPTTTQALQLQSGDASYVVQIHATRDTQALGLALDLVTTSSQVMALESGQRFECFVPLTPEKLSEQQQTQRGDAAQGGDKQQQVVEETTEQQKAAFLAFGRTAAKKIRPKCVQYVDMAENWVYEVCPGVLVRKVSLRARAIDGEGDAEGDDEVSDDVVDDESSVFATGSAAAATGIDKKAKMKKQKPTSATTVSATAKKQSQAAFSHEVIELGTFVSDTQAEPLAFEDFVGADTQERVSKAQKPLFTQLYYSSSSPGVDEKLQVQFICSATAVDDTVAGVQWRKTTPPPQDDDDSTDGSSKEARSVAGFLVVSRMFCNPKYADADEYKRFTVPSLLRPMVASNTCIKRSEGWWTYEFCFGKGIRQYHRDGEGQITAEFSLGVYDAEKNQELEASGGALVSEHIDATHDVARPAYLELYGQGSHCKEFDHWTPRRAKVYYYCSQGGSSHHILGVKETQTCVYAIKISSPALCDHPHFITEEQKSEAKAEVVHCVPMSEDQGQDSAMTTMTTTTTTTTTVSSSAATRAGASTSG